MTQSGFDNTQSIDIQSIERSSQPKPSSLRWLDQLKGMALLWIILIYGVERIFKPPLFSNPSSDWPPLSDRIAQLLPVTGFGLADGPLNLVRYWGWLGDQGVQLFLLASGFGLTWSLLQRRETQRFSWKQFYQRRLFRLYPMWWMAHGIFVVLLMVAGKSQEASWRDPAFYLSLLGVRFTQGTFYYLSASWWFIGLLLQLYLVFPLLYVGLRRWGAMRLLLITSLIALGCRGLGFWLLDSNYIDIWSRGNICLTRLPEFVLGISLASWFYEKPETTDRWLSSWKTQLASIGVYGLGLITAFTLPGMTVSPFLLGVGAFGLSYKYLRLWSSKLGVFAWVGRHSYALFLVHQLFFKALIPYDQISLQAFLRFGVACVISLGFAIGLEKSTDWVSNQVAKLTRWQNS